MVVTDLAQCLGENRCGLLDVEFVECPRSPEGVSVGYASFLDVLCYHAELFQIYWLGPILESLVGTVGLRRS